MLTGKDLEEAVIRDVRGIEMQTPDGWLSSREGIVAWYRELRRVQSDLTMQVATRRARVNAMRPPDGQTLTKRYLDASNDFKTWHTKIVYLLSRINDRKEHVLSIMRSLGLEIETRSSIDTLEQILMFIDTLASPEQAMKRVERIARNQLALHYQQIEMAQ